MRRLGGRSLGGREVSGIGDECPLMENAPKGMTARLPLNPLPFRFGFSDGTLGQGGSLGEDATAPKFHFGMVDWGASGGTAS